MDRKTEILEAAEGLVRKRGFDAFSYADLEQAVGIRKASIHHHFPSKSDLAVALINRYTDKMRHKLNEIASSGHSAGEQLNAYVDLYRSALTGGSTLCLCVALSAGTEQLTHPVLSVLEAYHEDSRDWLAALFSRGAQDGTIAHVADPIREASACLALVEGAQLQSRASKTLAPFELATAQLRARVEV